MRIPLPPGPGRFAWASVVLAVAALALPAAALVRRLASRAALRPFLVVLLLALGTLALLMAGLAAHDVALETLTATPADCSI